MGVAPVTPQLSVLEARYLGLAARGRSLAALQAVQIGLGMVGQFLLLARWSPHAQTDLFLLVSGVPWLVAAAALVGGLEMALPASYHRVLASGGEAGLRQFSRQAAGLGLATAVAAALISGVLVAGSAAVSGLKAGLCRWMGVALGGQVIPAALTGLWRGVLLARDRLVQARLSMLVGTLVTVTGYALLPGPPGLALPLATASAVLVSTLLAWYYGRTGFRFCGLACRRPFHPEIRRLLYALTALAAAAGLVHLQAIVERAAVLRLGTGMAAALAVASRGWEAMLALIVAACVVPVYPQWARSRARAEDDPSRSLLRWSLTRACGMSLVGACVIGAAAFLLAPVLEGCLRWESGAQAVQMTMALLPRFVLLTSLQPLVLKHYAQGTPWHPVIGAALGSAVIGLGALTLIPRWQLTGVMLTTVAGVVPGWVYLGWREWREARLCVS